MQCCTGRRWQLYSNGKHKNLQPSNNPSCVIRRRHGRSKTPRVQAEESRAQDEESRAKTKALKGLMRQLTAADTNPALISPGAAGQLPTPPPLKNPASYQSLPVPMSSEPHNSVLPGPAAPVPIQATPPRQLPAAGRQTSAPAQRQAALNPDLQPWNRVDLLVPGVAPIKPHVCSRKVIRQFCEYRNYVLTEEAADRFIPTIWQELQQIEHARQGVRVNMAIT